VDIPEALKLIAGRSAVAQHEAIKALRASGQAQQTRYNIVAEHALDDPQADFSPEEREALIALIDWPDDGGRTFMLRVRLTELERADLQARADQETAGDMSKLVRRQLFGA
jgi:hypothetical protein